MQVRHFLLNKYTLLLHQVQPNLERETNDRMLLLSKLWARMYLFNHCNGKLSTPTVAAKSVQVLKPSSL